MPSFPLPSWLDTHPDDIASKFATGVQIGAQLGEARNRLQQQAQQSAVENQVTQDKMMASALQQQQELQVKKAYEDQQVSLAQQKIQAAQAKVGLETAKAARQFQAQQAYQRDYQAGLDIGLESDEAARASYFKNLVQSGSPASVASAMRPTRTRDIQVPKTVDFTDAKGGKHTMAYVPGGTTLHELGQTSSKPDPFNLIDYRSKDTEKKQLMKTVAAAAPTISVATPADKQTYQAATNRIASLSREMEQMKGGGTAAPAASGAKFRFNPATGKIEPVESQAAPSPDDEDYTRPEE